MVGANEKAYDTYTNFKSKVIFQAQKELPVKTVFVLILKN